jgi:superfamily I DNA/RNA helicase
MQFTPEQIAIINSSGNIKINAVAGSGKTTTIIAYAKARPENSRMLYLAFNRSVKLEAVKKFADKGIKNVKVETAHSLAFKHIVFKSNYKVSPQGYKTNEIAELLGLQNTGEKHAEFVVANHINKMVIYFCNSTAKKVQELNYLDTVTDIKARTFVKTYYAIIEKYARQFLKKMDLGEIEITHDFYLKKFQLAKPQLHYDYILFDEGQDASPAMLDIFLNQKATKVIVGDTHQQIYAWRFAVNSLEKADFKTFHLSTSFRFSQDIANLAMGVLAWKSKLGEYIPVPISGKGICTENKTKAVLGRTNLGLLLKAIEYVTEKKKVNLLYFEGNINSYTYADDGASLYDVLHLYNGKHFLIKDRLIKAMKSIAELEEYIEKAEELQLAMMVEIVKEYGNEIPGIIKSIKDKHVPNDEKEKAEMIFSTVHRCKGMEYDAVHLVDDFMTEEKLKNLIEEGKKVPINPAKLNEEINLLYVAITRVKNTLHIPATLLPFEFPVVPQIHLIKGKSEEEKKLARIYGNQTHSSSAFSHHLSQIENNTRAEKNIEKPRRPNLPWTETMDEELTVMFCEGREVPTMAAYFGWTRGAILARIKKLELVELYG